MLKPVHSLNNVINMRKLYDTLELNISNLKELQVDVSMYGSLLIAIVFDCIPEELQIKISLKFGEHEWNLDDTMKVFISELEACERLHLNQILSRPRMDATRESGFRNHSARRKKIGNNYKAGNGNRESFRCVFCNEKHLSSRCRNVTDIAVRYNMVRRDNRCSVCLKKNYRSRECRLNYTCIKCNKKHNIALCQ